MHAHSSTSPAPNAAAATAVLPPSCRFPASAAPTVVERLLASVTRWVPWHRPVHHRMETLDVLVLSPHMQRDLHLDGPHDAGVSYQQALARYDHYRHHDYLRRPTL